MKKKLASLGLVATVLVLGWLLMNPQGGDPLAEVGARFQMATGLGDDQYELSELRYFFGAAAKINEEYVDPTRVEPPAMLVASLDRVARLVPEFLYTFDKEQSALRLVVGSEETEISVPALEGLADLTGVARKVAVFLDKTLDPSIERPPIEYAMVNGMLETLDPHSVYIEPDYYREMSIQNKGHFGGLGITIGIRESRLTILYPLKDTPAWRAGLKAGDRIDKIGSESTVNMSLQEAVGKLRGKEGTEVTITVSDGSGPDREVTITRARIEVPSVEWAYAGDGIGLIEVSHFAQQTFDRIEEALEELETQAIEDRQGRLRGVVLDLRQNPGGYLQQAIEVADKFLGSGVIVATEGLAGHARDVTQARKFGTEDELPLVVLVDESSASASEIVAGALQKHDRAAVLGVRTFGKGSVQNLYDRDFHQGALKLTIAQYLTAGNQSIQGVGVVPDIELRPALVRNDERGTLVRMFWQDFELREEDLEHAFDWGGQDAGARTPRWIYSCPECFESLDPDRESGPKDNLTDLEVQAGKALLLAAPSSQRSQQLVAAPAALSTLFSDREGQLVSELGELGIPWEAAPAQTRKIQRDAGSSPATVSLSVDSVDGMLTPGSANEVTLTVTNDSTAPLHRLRAVTEGEFFRGREFFFGKLEPGETRAFSVPVKPEMWLHARTSEVTWHFFGDGPSVPAPYVSRLQIKEVPHPRFAFSYQVIDDGSGASRGNGDGLLQPGEEIDLLVTVSNIGSGSTSETWLESLQDADEPSEEDAEAVDDDPNGFVQLRNRSGDALFLTEGSASFKLHPGELTSHRLHFQVAEDVEGLETIEASLLVGDEKFLELVETELDLPLFTPSDSVAAQDRTMRPKFGRVEIHTGASEHSEVVATATGPLAIDGRLGTWMRTSLPWGGSGWIAAGGLVASSRKESPVEPTRYLSNSPPVVHVADNPGGTVVVTEQLTLRGTIADDTSVKDLFVFVNDKKVSYRPVHGESSPHSFEVEVALEPGENQVEIFARDDQDHVGSLSLGVYRQTTTAARDAASPASR